LALIIEDTFPVDAFLSFVTSAEETSYLCRLQETRKIHMQISRVVQQGRLQNEGMAFGL
jgi:hypothetical protein